MGLGDPKKSRKKADKFYIGLQFNFPHLLKGMDKEDWNEYPWPIVKIFYQLCLLEIRDTREDIKLQEQAIQKIRDFIDKNLASGDLTNWKSVNPPPLELQIQMDRLETLRENESLYERIRDSLKNFLDQKGIKID